jgi:ADP-ribose pyrophosphatase YjhB (NUDIX family)
MAYIADLRSQVGHMPLILTSASGALVNADGAVLLQARTDTGDWGFPGGYMEFGERFTDTVRREFKEDAGLAVEPVCLLKILDNDQYTYPNGDAVQPVNAFYLVRQVSDQHFPVKPSETVTTRYFTLQGRPPRFFNHQHEKMWAILNEYWTKKHNVK